MNHHLLFRSVVGIVSTIAFSTLILTGQGQDPSPADADYVRVTNERATKIVQTLRLSDEDQVARVTATIAKFYQDLQRVHQHRDEIQTSVESEQSKLHYAFVARISAELPTDKVEQIKDGLTYGVVPNTYKYYLELYPSLDAQQKREIYALLLEAREHAMDAGSSSEKHAWFGKYKGRINNYLSKAGFDAKEAERSLKERQNKKP